MLEHNGHLLQWFSCGAQIVSWQHRARHILFPRQVVEVAGALKVRGGFHGCFPIFGPGPDSTQLPQHGHYRNLHGVVQADSDQPVVRILQNYGGEISGYPYPYELTTILRMKQDGFVYRTVARNTGTKSMPYTMAHHPYLNAPNGAVIQFIGGDASELVIEGAIGPQVFPFHPAVHVLLRGIGTVHFEFSGGFIDSAHSGIVVWSDSPGYLCIEPTTCTVLKTFGSRLPPDCRAVVTTDLQFEYNIQ